MRKILIAFCLILIYIGLSSIVKAQCSGTTTVGDLTSTTLRVGDGSSTEIIICIDNNEMVGGMCMGSSEHIQFFDSDGVSYGSIFSSTADGTCYSFDSPGGYVDLESTCLSASGQNTLITWESIDVCGNEVCSGTAPPCEDANCTTCSDPCGTCGIEEFSGTPEEYSWIGDNCERFPFIPPIGTADTDTRCHQLVAIDESVGFNVIVSSDCGAGGNVAGFTWELYDEGCGSPIQSGDLSNLTFSGLTIGNTYKFCYTFTVATGPAPSLYCEHTNHTPIFIGAETVVLPVELISFTVENKGETNNIIWTTASEYSNDFFKIEYSDDGKNWYGIARVDGLANTTTEMSYSYQHKDYGNSINYYRLSQTDFDGTTRYFDIVSVDNRKKVKVVRTVNLIGQEVDAYYKGIVIDFLDSGEALKRYQ